MKLKFIQTTILLLFVTVFISAQDYFEEHNLGVDYYNVGDYANALIQFEKAIDLLEELKWKKFKNDNVFLEAADSAACLGDTAKAYTHLQAAMGIGFFEQEKFNEYPCINDLKELDQFKLLLEEMDNKQKKYSHVRLQLEEVKRRDQVLRRLVGQADDAFKKEPLMWQTYKNTYALLDSINVVEVTAILDQYGWLQISEIGKDASSAYWLILVHGDKDLINSYLPLVKKQAELGNVDAEQYAIFQDKYYRVPLLTPFK